MLCTTKQPFGFVNIPALGLGVTHAISIVLIEQKSDTEHILLYIKCTTELHYNISYFTYSVVNVWKYDIDSYFPTIFVSSDSFTIVVSPIFAQFLHDILLRLTNMHGSSTVLQHSDSHLRDS